MNNIDIRKNVINNFKDSDAIDIETSIVSSIKEGDEITLPGLGVLFEVMWKNSNADMKNHIIEAIQKGLK